MGKGKKSAFVAWNSCPGATEGFLKAASGNIDEAKEQLEEFVVRMYDKSCSVGNVDACRMKMFQKSQKRLPENIPPTSNALHHHALRAAYQGRPNWHSIKIT